MGLEGPIRSYKVIILISRLRKLRTSSIVRMRYILSTVEGTVIGSFFTIQQYLGLLGPFVIAPIILIAKLLTENVLD